MGRLIDAKAGKKVFSAIAQPAEYKGVLHMVVPISEIDKLPTVDAVEVVRCKECKHHREYCFGGSAIHECGYWNRYLRENGFCSHGERRTDGK